MSQTPERPPPPSTTHLKGVRRVVHTVHPQAVAHGADLHAAEHGQLQPLDGALRQRLAHQCVGARLVQQQVAARRVHQAVTGCGLLLHRHHFLQERAEGFLVMPEQVGHGSS